MGRRRYPAHNSPNQQQPNSLRHGHDQVIPNHHDQRDQDHRFASHPIRQSAQKGAKQKLHQRKNRGQCAGPNRCIGGCGIGEDRFEQFGHHRDHDTDPHRVEQYRHQDDDNWKVDF